MLLERFNQLDKFYQENYLNKKIENPLAFYLNRRLIYKYLFCLAEIKKIKIDNEENLTAVAKQLKESGLDIFTPELVLAYSANDNIAEMKGKTGKDFGEDGYEILAKTRDLVKDYLTGQDIINEAISLYGDIDKAQDIVGLTHYVCEKMLIRIADINNIEYVLPNKMRLLYLTDILSEKLNSHLIERLINVDYYFHDFEKYSTNLRYKNYCIKLLADVLLLI